MCILFVYANGNPKPGGYKLILASNRDEFYARPAASADRWSDATHVFGGIDLEPGREGGTWLAISGKNGIIKFGALLNITGEMKTKNALGRGPIVADYVKGNKSNEEYCTELLDHGEKYSGFNFVSVEIKNNNATIMNCSNVPLKSHYEEWSDGKCHSFGNSPTKTPFRKVKMGKDFFQKIVDEYDESNNSIDDNKKMNLVEKCMDLLKLRTKYWPDNEIIKRAPTDWAENLSSICVCMPDTGYGSRTRTVILIDSNNKMDFYEETMLTDDPDGEWKTTHLEEQF